MTHTPRHSVVCSHHVGARTGIAGLRPLLLCAGLLLHVAVQSAASAAGPAADAIKLELRPRVCTLSEDDQRCETRVKARWQSQRRESLCLFILNQPGIKQCWEQHTQGTYSIDLVFSDDLRVELRDSRSQHVLAAEAIRVIREALRFRYRRRQPWNILY